LIKYQGIRAENISNRVIFKMVFCCKICKSKESINLEKTLKAGIKQVINSLDINEVIKTAQSVKCLKEIILDDYQKIIYEKLFNPIVIENKIRSAYDSEAINNPEDLLKKQNENLKQTILRLSDFTKREEIDQKLINLLPVIPKLKRQTFSKGGNLDNIISQFFRKMHFYFRVL
jgi:hypothetical protein